MTVTNLKEKTTKAISWYGLEKISTTIFQFVINIILARILDPKDFGIIGIIFVFISVSTIFIGGGFGQALIQKYQPTETEYSSVFYFNLVVAILLYGLLFLTAPIISQFYNDPNLTLVIRIVAINLLIISATLVQSIQLTKRINFKLQTQISIVSNVISGIISICLAFYGFSYWALVFQVIISNTIRSILLWKYNKWLPLFSFKYYALKGLFSYGSRIFFAGLISTIYDNISSLLIGKFYSPILLGYYTQAKKIQEAPVSNISATLEKVTFPVLAIIQDDNIRLKRGYKDAMKMLVFINFPLMFCLLAVSDSLIITLFTAKWAESSYFLNYLCIIGLTYPLQSLNLNIIKVKGRSDLYLNIEIVKKVISIFIIIYALFVNITYFLLGQVFISFFSFIINSFYSGKLIDYPLKEQLKDIMPYFISSLIVFIFVFSEKYLFTNHSILLVTQITSYIIIYIMINYLFKMGAFIESISLLKNLYLNYTTNKKITNN